MPRLLVLQHVPFEPLGNLDPLLREAGFRVRYVNFGRDPHARPRLGAYCGLVVLGGPMSPYDDAGCPHLPAEAGLIGDAVDAGIPVLGICLGAQLLARALGAAVRPCETPEIGWHEVALTGAGRADRLLGQLAPRERIMQWHSDTFDLPEGAVHLAASERCENQAFRYGENAWGFQFHLEADERLIRRWLGVPEHVEELAAQGGGADAIRRDTVERIARARDASRRVFGEFVSLLGAPRRRVVLPSR